MPKFLPYIHYLRGLAILFIVGVHVRGYEWNWREGDQAFDFFVALFDNGTVLFVFIAGFLFQHLTHDRLYFDRYLTQKAKVVVLPYLILSMPIIILRLVEGSGELPLSPEFDQLPALYRIFFFLLTGMHMAPFWFMPMIFLVYLSAPLLHKADNSKFYKYIFPVIFLLGMFTYRSLHNANPLLSYLHFLPIYLTGMWASFYKDRIIAWGKYLFVPLVLIYLSITVLELTDIITLDKKFNFNRAIDEGRWLFNIYVFKAIILCFILQIIFHRVGERGLAWLDTLANYSFGIYFIHYYFISLIRKLLDLLHMELVFTVWSFLAFYLAVLLLSVMLIYIVKKVAGENSRFLVGS